MRYILNNEGYIDEISFLHEIECKNKTCTEYTGTIPEGYSSLVEWNENAVIQAYKITNGNLTHDPNKEAELIAQWETEGINKELYYVPNEKYLFEAETSPASLWLGGTLTTSRKQIVFTLFLPKSLKHIQTITCEEMNWTVRSTLGSYAANGVVDTNKIEIHKSYDNAIAILYTADTAVDTSISPNNAPVAVCVKSLKLTFS